MMDYEEEQIRRWRLILGETAVSDEDDGTAQPGEGPGEGEPQAGGNGQGEGSGSGLSPTDQQIDEALSELYGSDGGDLSDAQPDIARWLGDIRRYFPDSVAQVMQREMLSKSKLRQLLKEPDLFDHIEPDVSLVADILALRRVMPSKTKQTAREVVQRIVAALREKLERPLTQAVRGAMHRPSRTRRPKYKEINWGKTIHKNLRHYQPSERTIVAETLVGYGRQERGLRDLILAVDTSGSMSASVVYASIYAAVLASLPALSTRLVLFSTAVVDVTDELQDPVDLLFGVQLRGGTNIEKAVGYCQQQVVRPADTTLILITDLFEGGDKGMLLERIGALVQQGVQVIVLLALHDKGTPRFDRDLANQMVQLGVPSFGCTPEQFPELMGTILNGRDVHQWAAGAGIVTAPDN